MFEGLRWHPMVAQQQGMSGRVIRTRRLFYIHLWSMSFRLRDISSTFIPFFDIREDLRDGIGEGIGKSLRSHSRMLLLSLIQCQ